RGCPLGRRHRRRSRYGARRDRVRRAAERRQVEPVERAARRGAGDCLARARDHARRDRHPPGLGSERGRAHRYSRHPTAREGRLRRSRRALLDDARADVAVLVIDAVEGLTSQDAHVAGYAVEEGKGLVLAVNKWDLVEDKTDRTFDQYIDWIRNDAPFLEFAPVVSISAKTGQRVGRVLELADRKSTRLNSSHGYISYAVFC